MPQPSATAAKDVVVVESPAKARTLTKYLGKDYTVLASYGHVRDLAARDNSVQPDNDFAMRWEEKADSRRHLAAIAHALKGARRLYLATDPDREGEAISWHVRSSLEERHALKGVEARRIAFHEITPGAIQDAMRHPRDINNDLVEAYFARRALDYLVGFTLSPVLWRKLPASRSAGRVQSVALRLICEREDDIERFAAKEYWQLRAALRSVRNETFQAKLTQLQGRKLGAYELDRAGAEAAHAILKKAAPVIASVATRKVARRPKAPFTTSTLQQDAGNRAGFSARHTMRLAQQLYEGIDTAAGRMGLITYMRTDSTQLGAQAVSAMRAWIGQKFGADYLPAQPRLFKTKSRNAQEAHEAIRPTDIRREPASLASRLNEEQLRLYTLIWRRALACQMSDAVMEQSTADIEARDAKGGVCVLHAAGSRVAFDGFLKVYADAVVEGKEGKEGEDEEGAFLPLLNKGEAATLVKAATSQHFTKPPPRYSEASLVKKLEELGIGRPSTYAPIIGVLQERSYVRLDKRRFIPEDRGRVLTSFLRRFFERYVRYEFTADLEDKLDEVSHGKRPWKQVLREFWDDFIKAVGATDGLSRRDVIERLNDDLAPVLFGGGGKERSCPQCGKGELSLKFSRFGAFLGCSRYPDCRHARPLPWTQGEGGNVAMGERTLGKDPESNGTVSVRDGPYGPYLQLDLEGEKPKGAKPKRVGLRPPFDASSIDLATAVKLLELPRKVANHPVSGADIVAGLGPFGPFVRHDYVYASLEEGDDVLSIGANRAIALILQSEEKRKARGERELGAHAEGGVVRLRRGRFGFYVEHGKLRATLPRGSPAKEVTLPQALTLLAAKAKADKSALAARRVVSRAPARKGGAGKTTAGRGRVKG